MEIITSEPQLNHLLGLRISEARYKAGMTQNEMAIKVGVGRTTYQGIEGGTKPIKMITLNRVIELTGCDPLWLYGVKEKPCAK